MKIVKTLNVPAEFFYQQIINSVIFDIRKSTGETVKEHQLTNYSYVKEFSKSSRAKITIEEAQKNQRYRFNTSTVRNEFNVTYDIKAVSDSQCEVTYTEEMTSHGVLQKANDTLFGLFLVPFKKKQLVKMLESMEASY
ncbi:DUF3284 domain-containing protein [Vagococcus zengguangii]|uniref:DUF3284 domain-containing protein n=1 Tax=Vagococcus zengguangii TaxID=2571750 RepID=A0A4D7CXD7_9ENTE|nr:DUF3284 domain-containing protein [Vagococcus zengguangii]QCI87057.1 DUF3284 domain-containing protein [Vagococcus zengguangii]TLG80904.1 DUF3284 domain-containing protein [Vagococcus zengguangii]